MNKIEVKNIEDLQKVIECIKASGKNIVILSGTLGSGKTTLTKEFVKSLEIDENVTSPTFSIQNIYEDKVFHYDLYNKTLEDFLRLGMLEELEKDGYHFIEWGEELETILRQFGFDYLKIEIELTQNKRIFNCIN
jgi:tRNA threonylcarbamoyladenosine biosynthesis protein TsaE